MNPDLKVTPAPALAGERLCAHCHQPLEPGAHALAKYHRACAQAKARAANKRYYVENAEQLRRARREKYRRQQAASA